MSNIKSDRKTQLSVVTAVSTPLIESKIIRAFIQAELNIAERLFDLAIFPEIGTTIFKGIFPDKAL